MTAIGHNNPPSVIEFADSTVETLGEWLKEHPVIQSEEDAREGKLLLDRAKGCLGDLEAERDGKVRPLNEQVKTINATYSTPRQFVESVLSILKDRITAYAKVEEEKRWREAEEKRRIAEEAERKAREAEELERTAKDDALQGVVTDEAAATQRADQAFQEYERTQREAARAQASTNVKIGGGFNRAVGLRKKETLVIVDWKAALEQMGITPKIEEAILSSARDFRKTFDELPNGVEAQYERSL